MLALFVRALPPGYTGVNCTEDINECNMGLPCGDVAVQCYNQPGTFSCDCPQGYTGAPCQVSHTHYIRGHISSQTGSY